jgi:hypothetical protein
MAAQARVEDERRLVSWSEFFEQLTANRRLARADFAGELDEAFPLANAEQEMIERLLMLRAEKQKARVRRNIKRRFPQVVVLQVHLLKSPNMLPSP